MPAADDPAGAKYGCLYVEVYVPHEASAGDHRGTLIAGGRRRGADVAREPVRLELYPAGLSQFHPGNELLRPAAERARLLPAGPRPSRRPQQGPVPPPRRRGRGLRPRLGRQAPRLDGVGQAVRPLLRRLGVRRFAAQGSADGGLLPAAVRELADADGGQLQRRLLGRPRFPRQLPQELRRGFAAVRRAHPRQALGRHVLPVLLQRQEQLQGERLVARHVPVAAGRAVELPGLLGAALVRRRVARGDQPGAAGQGEAGVPLRHFPSAMAARRPGRRAGLQRGGHGDAAVPADRGGPQGGERRGRGGVRRQQRGRGLEHAAGRLVDRRLDARRRRRAAVADGRLGRVVEEGRRAVAVLPRPRRQGGARCRRSDSRRTAAANRMWNI